MQFRPFAYSRATRPRGRPAIALLESTALKPARAHVSRRWLVGAGLTVAAMAVLLPNWVIGSRDDEALFLEVASTTYQAKHLFLGWFWDPFVAFGSPMPFSQTLSYHPILLAFRWGSVPFAVALFYQLQLWIALFSVWAVCRHLRIRPAAAWLCVFSFATCTATLNYLSDFWLIGWLDWTLSPLLLLLVLRLLDATDTWSRAFDSVAAGLCIALMLLDGHAGVFPAYALGIAVFVAASSRRLLELWRWFGLLLLVFALCTATRFYDIGLEYFRAPAAERNQQLYPMNWASLLFYPIPSREHGYRLLAIGGPFFVLTIVGICWLSLLRGAHVNALRIAAVFSFFAWFFVAKLITPMAGNYFFRDPFSLFAILLSGLTLQALWQRYSLARPLLLLAAAVQIAALVWGFYPLYRLDAQLSLDYLRGKLAPSVRAEMDDQPIYRYFEQLPDRTTTRAYIAGSANDRITRSRADYEFAAWGLRGLRLVNGHFRGTDMSSLLPVKETLLSEIFADPPLATSRPALDVLNIGYVLGEPSDKVAPGLRRIRRFRLYDGAVIDVYRNATAWPDAVLLSPQAKSLESLPARKDCSNPGLLCGDFTRVVSLRRPRDVAAETWHGATLDVRLRPARHDSVLMLSQLYRPGWQAHFSNGKTVSGFELFGALTGFDVPAGTTSASIDFRPAPRMALAALSWAAILLGAGFLVAVSLMRRRRVPREGRGYDTAA